MELIIPNSIKQGLFDLRQRTARDLEKLTKAYEAISTLDGLADMPPATADVGTATTKKVDGRSRNGGNSTKAKDPSKDGRRNNGRKPGRPLGSKNKPKETVTARSARKRAVA